MSPRLDAQPGPPAAARSGRATAGLWLLAALGTGVFLAGVSGPYPQRAWLAYLVNWLFWSGLALSGLAFTAMLRLTKAEWAGPLRGTAEALAGFLPVSLLLFGPLFLGREHLFSWITHPIPAKAVWLNTPFLIARDVAGLIVLYGVGFYLFRAARRDREPASSRSATGNPRTPSAARLTALSVLFLVLYSVVGSLLAFDLVMSLDPHWISTLFGAYVCIGNLYAGLGLLAVLGWLLPTLAGSEAEWRSVSHDLGKLLFGFCILWTYLFWCHYLPIWYANLPEETGFLIVRLHTAPWQGVSWAVLLLNFLLPFPLLLLQWIKRTPRALAAVGASVVTGMWLERYVLVVPSVWHETWLPLGWLELGVLGGFAALFALSFRMAHRAAWFTAPDENALSPRCR